MYERRTGLFISQGSGSSVTRVAAPGQMYTRGSATPKAAAVVFTISSEEMLPQRRIILVFPNKMEHAFNLFHLK